MTQTASAARLFCEELYKAAFESILNKREQYPIFLLIAVKERTNMTRLCKLRAGEMNGRRGLHSVVLP